jgi:hypothetical protein
MRASASRTAKMDGRVRESVSAVIVSVRGAGPDATAARFLSCADPGRVFNSRPCAVARAALPPSHATVGSEGQVNTWRCSSG